MVVGRLDGSDVGRLVGSELGKVVGTEVGKSVGTLVGMEVGTLVGTLVGMEVGTLVGMLVGSDVGVGVAVARALVVGFGVERVVGVPAAACFPDVPVPPVPDGAGVPAFVGLDAGTRLVPLEADWEGAGIFGLSVKSWGEMTGDPVATRTAIWRTMASSGRRITSPTMAIVAQTVPPTATVTMPGVRLDRPSSASSSRSSVCWGTCTMSLPSARGSNVVIDKYLERYTVIRRRHDCLRGSRRCNGNYT
jgi:hypothetical protein